MSASEPTQEARSGHSNVTAMADQTEVPGGQVAPARQVLRVVRGNPTAEELGAVVALLAARSGGAVEDETTPEPSLWNAPASLLRRPLAHGPGAWKASAFPL